MTGFFLKVRPDLVVKEPVYGVHPEKAEKVLRSFKVFQRNLGVILSGDKGIGKSLFARLLSAKAVEAGYPVIIVDQLSRALRLTLSPLNRRLYSCLTSLTKPLVAIMIPIHNPHF